MERAASRVVVHPQSHPSAVHCSHGSSSSPTLSIVNSLSLSHLDVCQYALYGCIYHSMWRGQDNFRELVLSFYCVSLGIELGSLGLVVSTFALRHLAGLLPCTLKFSFPGYKRRWFYCYYIHVSLEWIDTYYMCICVLSVIILLWTTYSGHLPIFLFEVSDSFYFLLWDWV